MIRKQMLVVAVLSALLAAGCASNNKQRGALIGGAAGAVLGGVIGNQSDHTAEGAIVGAVVGGAAGAIIGDYMDDQAKELEQVEGADVERVGEGIKVTFDSGILFAVNKHDLTAESKLELKKMARVLNEYDDTNILIEGHTDADGADDYNQTLSERRAQSVKAYLASLNVGSSRMTTMGYGESQPIADNSTADGKSQNRRVEVVIVANDELKAEAAKKAAQG
jgi:outer membrane protein OmpA-like peptidoglycan-associated protein